MAVEIPQGAVLVMGGRVEKDSPSRMVVDEQGWTRLAGQQRAAGYVLETPAGWEAWAFDYTYEPVAELLLRDVSSSYLDTKDADHAVAWEVWFADWTSRGCPEEDTGEPDPLVVAHFEEQAYYAIA